MTEQSKLELRHFGEIAENFIEFVRENLIKDTATKYQYSPLDERYRELEKHYFGRGKLLWNYDKVKILFELLKLDNEDDLEKVLSYLENTRHGWNGDVYSLNNRCLQHSRHGNDQCRRIWQIKHVDSMENANSASEIFDMMQEIFLGTASSSEYHIKTARTTVYIFSYCLTALFSSKLNNDRCNVPYFLQIACEKDSLLYKLIHEIVEICDVNFGLINHCSNTMRWRYCGYEHKVIYPGNADKDMADLVGHRDIPVIIDGFENIRQYQATIRMVANLPNSSVKLAARDGFNILPIFVCSEIASGFRNVISMDLTELTVSRGYLEFIRHHKQHLASWVLELVNQYKEYFFATATHEQNILQTYNKSPFFKAINDNAKRILLDNRDCEVLSRKDATNIGILTFFFESSA